MPTANAHKVPCPNASKSSWHTLTAWLVTTLRTQTTFNYFKSWFMMKTNSSSRPSMYSTVTRTMKIWSTVYNVLLTSRRRWVSICNQLQQQASTITWTRILGSAILSNTISLVRAETLTIKVMGTPIRWSVQTLRAKGQEPLLKGDTLGLSAMSILMYRSISIRS